MTRTAVSRGGLYRPTAMRDVSWAAGQHAALMENSVFAVFGKRFLEQVYSCFAASKHSISYVYEEESEAKAIIASTSDRGAFLRELFLRSGIRLAALSAAAVFRSSACRRMLWRMPVYLGRTCRGNTKAEMVFITVAKNCRKAGIARELIRMTLEEFGRRGVRDINVSIESSNTVVKDLLLHLGFTVSDHFMFADKPNDLLAISLPDRTAT